MKNKRMKKIKHLFKAKVKGKYYEEYVKLYVSNYKTLSIEKKRKVLYFLSKILKERIGKIKYKEKGEFKGNEKRRVLEELERDLRKTIQEIYELNGFKEILKLKEAYGYELYLKCVKESDYRLLPLMEKIKLTMIKNKMKKEILKSLMEERSGEVEYWLTLTAKMGDKDSINWLYYLKKSDELMGLLNYLSPFSKTKNYIIEKIETLTLFDKEKQYDKNFLFMLAQQGSIKAAKKLEDIKELGMAKQSMIYAISNNKIKRSEIAKYLDELRIKTAGKEVEDITSEIKSQHGSENQRLKFVFEVSKKNTYLYRKENINKILNEFSEKDLEKRRKNSKI